MNKENIIAAALGGLLMGLGAPALASPSAHENALAKSGSAQATDDHGGDKHACKGKNSCKGKGGCKTEKHACKGQNSCKGQGGCATDGSKPK